MDKLDNYGKLLSRKWGEGGVEESIFIIKVCKSLMEGGGGSE